MRQIRHSQNFIKNTKLLESLIENSSISKSDLVFDLGAGTGEITKILNRHSKKVIAIEKDNRLYNGLKEKFKSAQNVNIINKDILDLDFPDRENYKVFSNIPFNYTADILHKLTGQKNPPDDIYLFIQKQAAMKYLGEPKESLQSLFTKIHYTPSIIHNLKKSDFRPIPKVDTVLFRLEKLDSPALPKNDEIEFKNFLAFGFSQFKPTLRQNFERIFTDRQFQRLSKDLKFNPKSKATDLPFEIWLSLYGFFKDNIETKKKKIIKYSYSKLLRQQKNLSKIHRTRANKN